MSGFDRLERFETKHGEYVDLLDDYVQKMTDLDMLYSLGEHERKVIKAAMDARHLLDKHSEQVTFAVAWHMSRRNILKYSILKS